MPGRAVRNFAGVGLLAVCETILRLSLLEETSLPSELHYIHDYFYVRPLSPM